MARLPKLAMAPITLAARPYARPFRRPLTTHHGPWTVRQGWIVRGQDLETGRVGWGEVAPIPWFGTESWAEAGQYLADLGETSRRSPFTACPPVPNHLPACQFGIGSAWAQVSQPDDLPLPEPRPDRSAALLPLLGDWPAQLDTLIPQGYRTFKVKIAVASPQEEQAQGEALLAALPGEGRIRLDANGGLSRETALDWLQWIQAQGDGVEFLEQPLPPQDWPGLMALEQQWPGRVALDEAVATVAQMVRVGAAGWRGLVVVKPAIAGWPGSWIAPCRRWGWQPILSTALETAIGRRAIWADWQGWLALGGENRAVGLGAGDWFAGDGPSLSPEALWQQLDGSGSG